MPNYKALQTELTDDPLTVGYAGMSDTEAADSLNALTRPAKVHMRDVMVMLHRLGKWTALVDSAEPVARQATDLLNKADTLGMVDVYDDLSQALLGGLAAVGIITSDDKAAVESLAANGQSRAAEIGWRTVTSTDIERVR